MAKVEPKANGESQPDIHRKLTEKQEAFCQAYSVTKMAADAYRSAYNTKASPNTVQTEAYKLLQRPYIAHRVEQLRAKRAEINDVTVLELTTEYRRAIIAGHEAGQISSAVAAITGLGKLHGLITDKVDLNAKVSLSEEFESFIRRLNAPEAPKQLDVIDIEAGE